MESYYDCLTAEILRENFSYWNMTNKNCTKKCLPDHLTNNTTLQCEHKDDVQCALEIIYWKYIRHSNCPKSCSIVKYSGRIEYWDQNHYRNESSLTIYLFYSPPVKAKVYQEFLIYNFFDMFGSVGGTLGIFIGFSLNTIFNIIINCCKNIRFGTPKWLGSN